MPSNASAHSGGHPSRLITFLEVVGGAEQLSDQSVWSKPPFRLGRYRRRHPRPGVSPLRRWSPRPEAAFATTLWPGEDGTCSSRGREELSPGHRLASLQRPALASRVAVGCVPGPCADDALPRGAGQMRGAQGSPPRGPGPWEVPQCALATAAAPSRLRGLVQLRGDSASTRP